MFQNLKENITRKRRKQLNNWNGEHPDMNYSTGSRVQAEVIDLQHRRCPLIAGSRPRLLMRRPPAPTAPGPRFGYTELVGWGAVLGWLNRRVSYVITWGVRFIQSCLILFDLIVLYSFDYGYRSSWTSRIEWWNSAGLPTSLEACHYRSNTMIGMKI